MDNISYWTLFFSSALLLNISPGPDMIYILSRTLAQGSKIGVATVFGVCTGALVHILGAAAGFAAIIATSESAFIIIKVIGALYLGYLGVQALIGTSGGLNISNTTEHLSVKNAYFQGILVDVLNPKVALFFLAFLPQFVRPEIGHNSLQIVGLGMLVVLIAIFVELMFVLFATKTRNFFIDRKNTSFVFNKILGIVFLGLGTKLLLM